MKAKKVSAKTGCIACPMVEVSCSESAYGQMEIAKMDIRYLDQWSKTIGISTFGTKTVAYLSELFSNILGNISHSRFDDEAINTGFFIQSIKKA